MELEFVRDTQRLVCDGSDWWESCELATAFGWRPSFPGAKSRLYELAAYPLNVPAEDALSLFKGDRTLFDYANKQREAQPQTGDSDIFVDKGGDGFGFWCLSP